MTDDLAPCACEGNHCEGNCGGAPTASEPQVWVTAGVPELNLQAGPSLRAHGPGSRRQRWADPARPTPSIRPTSAASPAVGRETGRPAPSPTVDGSLLLIELPTTVAPANLAERGLGCPPFAGVVKLRGKEPICICPATGERLDWLFCIAPDVDESYVYWPPARKIDLDLLTALPLPPDSGPTEKMTCTLQAKLAYLRATGQLSMSDEQNDELMKSLRDACMPTSPTEPIDEQINRMLAWQDRHKRPPTPPTRYGSRKDDEEGRSVGALFSRDGCCSLAAMIAEGRGMMIWVENLDDSGKWNTEQATYLVIGVDCASYDAMGGCMLFLYDAQWGGTKKLGFDDEGNGEFEDGSGKYRVTRAVVE